MSVEEHTDVAASHRLQRVRQRATENTRENNSTMVGEVNPEFLAALPPNIQEEVLTQQRLEQQRQQAARANPDDPMDPVSFLQTLPSSLRQTVSVGGAGVGLASRGAMIEICYVY